MSNPSAPVSRQQTVRVDFDPNRPSLKVSPTDFTVAPGDVVIWQFFGLTRKWYPWIRFLRESLGESGTGPLENFSQSSDAIWGTVRAIAAGRGSVSYDYRASARVLEGLDADQASASVSSTAARFSVRESSSAKSRDEAASLITVDVEVRDGQLFVPDDKRQISIFGGQSIRWNFPAEIFDGAASGPVLPRVQFLEYQALGTATEPIDLRLGPFTTMTFGSRSVTATGYVQNPPGTYNYRLLAISESDGEILWASSPDPLVDDRGEPPPG